MAYGLSINGTAIEFGNNKSKKACRNASLFVIPRGFFKSPALPRAISKEGRPETWSSFFVIPRGFEPRTHSLEGCCSIQLSYGTEGANIRIFPEYP